MLFAHMGMEHSSPKIMMSFNLSFLEIILRLSMATIFAAIIGLDRKEHNHPAGLRTHILVCLGACILALIQEAICNQVLYYAKNFHILSTVLESDPARLIAQVIAASVSSVRVLLLLPIILSWVLLQQPLCGLLQVSA